MPIFAAYDCLRYMCAVRLRMSYFPQVHIILSDPLALPTTPRPGNGQIAYCLVSADSKQIRRTISNLHCANVLTEGGHVFPHNIHT